MSSAIKAIVVIIFVLVLIGVCFAAYSLLTQEPVEEPIQEGPEDFYSTILTEENFPKMDASLATQPLTDAFYQNFVGLNPADFDGYKEYTNTHWGYERLITGHTTFKDEEYEGRDIIVVTYPSEEEQQLAKDNNVELDIRPVVNEGFVFFVNKDNPVNNLTLKQIQDIYSVKITNWKEVGGLDEEMPS